MGNVSHRFVPGRQLKFAGFVLTAFSVSWIFWIPAALFGQVELQPVYYLLYLLGGFGPTIAGVFSIRRERDMAAEKDIIHRLTGIRLINGPWYVFIFALFPLLAITVIVIYRLTRGIMPSLPSLNGFTGQIGDFLTLMVIAVQSFILGPLSEEIGWRGYALDNLQKRFRPITASLILGLLWGLWHFPLFFIKGSMYYEWGTGTWLFWLFFIRMIALTIIMTVVYNANHRSILSAILLHFMFNFTFVFLQPAPIEIHGYGTLILVLLAGFLFLRFKNIPEIQPGN